MSIKEGPGAVASAYYSGIFESLNTVKAMISSMRIPCELIVWYVLPSIRRELARELVDKHHLSQAEVARRFGVTDAAVSQYLKSKRGNSKEIENSGKYEDFQKEVAESAVRMMNGSDIVTETCRICGVVKKSGMMVKIYEIHSGARAPECIACETK
jgi:predicted transcriptional regulator